MTEKFIIGLVGAPFGVKGFLKVHSCSGEINHLLKLQSVFVSKDGNERLVQIEETQAGSAGFVLMRFAGIDAPETAKSFTGAQLIVNREQAAPLDDGEFYVEDLKGLTVNTETGETIGCIVDVIEGGGGELAEIALTNGGKRLVPFRKEFFTEITPEKGKIVLKNLWILD